MISVANLEPEEPQREPDSVISAAALSQPERIFCEVFTANGGKATEAAIAAGYAEGSAHVAASRLLCRKRVADYIEKLCRQFAHTGLPVAIQTLIAACSDEKALWKDRIKAANSLVEMAGLMPTGNGVQVNVGVQVNGQQAQQLITSVWEAKQARLSDIPTAMTDNLRTIEGAVERLEEDGRGGDRIEGSRPAPVALPPHSTENSPISEVSPDPLRAWREATKGEDDGE